MRLDCLLVCYISGDVCLFTYVKYERARYSATSLEALAALTVFEDDEEEVFIVFEDDEEEGLLEADSTVFTKVMASACSSVVKSHERFSKA